MLFEGCEESGSRDLPHYMDKLSDRIGTPDLICCLDAGCGNYNQLWMTTSLRGNVAFKLTVEMLLDGAHSGNASGIVPSSFRIMRQLRSAEREPIPLMSLLVCESIPLMSPLLCDRRLPRGWRT